MASQNKRPAIEELESETSNNKKSRNLISPLPSWLKDWQWLEYLEVNGSLYMFCKWCKAAKYDNIFTRGTNIFKRDIVKRHDEKDQKHQKAKQQFLHLSTYQLDNEDIKIIQQMKCVYFVAKKHLSFNIYSDLYCLIASNNYISSEPQSLKFALQETIEPKNYGTYLNPAAARNFAKAIVHTIETSLITEIKLSKSWSLMIDESTSIDEKHLVIASQHMAFNTPIIRYIGLIKLEDCKAESIMENLENFIAEKNLNIIDIMHFGSDGASTMIGQDAAKMVPYFIEYEDIYKSLYSYFSSSYKRMVNLKMIQEINEDPQLNLLNIINTRWLSISNAVKNLHQILDSIKDALNYDIINGNKQDKKKAADLLEHYISISDVQFNLEATISAITTQFIGYDNIAPTYGIFLQTYIIENFISLEHLPLSITRFAIAIIQNLRSRFPNTTLYNAMKIFEPNLLPLDNLSTYEDIEIEILADFY
ncbi:1260_t:CDS:2, partial [Acaulospora morrowiae]